MSALILRLSFLLLATSRGAGGQDALKPSGLPESVKPNEASASSELTPSGSVANGPATVERGSGASLLQGLIDEGSTDSLLQSLVDQHSKKLGTRRLIGEGQSQDKSWARATRGTEDEPAGIDSRAAVPMHGQEDNATEHANREHADIFTMLARPLLAGLRLNTTANAVLIDVQAHARTEARWSTSAPAIIVVVGCCVVVVVVVLAYEVYITRIPPKPEPPPPPEDIKEEPAWIADTERLRKYDSHVFTSSKQLASTPFTKGMRAPHIQ